MSEQAINNDAEIIATRDEALQLAEASTSDLVEGQIIVKATHDEHEQYPSQDGPETVPAGHVRLEILDTSGRAIPAVQADPPKPH